MVTKACDHGNGSDEHGRRVVEDVSEDNGLGGFGKVEGESEEVIASMASWGCG